MEKGLFITFEGGDGSGKTTQINLLKKYLEEKNIEVMTLREPGGVSISEKIRQVVLDNKNTEMNAVTEMLLYAAARAQLVAQVIIPTLEQGTTILCDRFVDSSYIYQGFARGLGMDMVKTVNDIATQHILPDITFFMDTDPEKSIRRRYDAGQPDRIELEGLTFHKSVYEGYRKLVTYFPERIKPIDGDKGIDDAFSQIKLYVDTLLCR